MRTKALLLAAAFAAAGVATSVAQVYSVNAVGYVNVTLVPGFTMVANPLDAGTGNNTVGKLFSNVTPSIPAGLKVFIFDATTGAFGIPANYIPGVGFSPAASANTEILPGNGVFVFNPAATPLTATFVGQVMQGNLSNPLPQGFSIKGNQVPQAGKPDSFGLPQTAGDKIFKFDTATGQYAVPSTSTGTLWLPPTPSIGVGEGFFMFRATSPGTWNRTFSVNG